MVNTNMLRGKIVERGTNISAVAEKMGIDKTTLYRRFTDGDEFTIGEAQKIRDILNLSYDEAVAIFFSQ